MNAKTLLLLAAVGTAGVLATGCRSEASQHASAQPPAPAVTVAPVAEQEVTEWDEFTGRTEAVETVEVRPRISGHIEAVRFQSGQMVNKGDVLFVIDPRWHQAEFDRAKAEHKRAHVRFDISEREAKRAEQLRVSQVISAEEADARIARAAEAKAALLAADAALDAARLDLEHTQIRAPIGGRVSRALVTPGNHVSGVPGFTTVLTTIVSVDPVYVYSDVDEGTLLKFNALMQARKLGAEDQPIHVEMQLGDDGGFAHHGRIESFDNRVDPGTGSILLRTVFPNPDGRIVPGLFARVRVPGSATYPALLIEESAIGTDQSQKFVLTVTSTNTVEYRPVKLGPAVDGKRVVRSGLTAGDRVIVNGLQRVRPGMAVAPQTTLAAVAASSPTVHR